MDTKLQFPKRWNRIITAAWLLVLLGGGAEYVLEWARAIYAVLFIPLKLPLIVFLDPYQDVLATLLVSNLGFGASLIIARALAFLAPTYSIEEDRLVATTRLGTRVIPFDSVQKVYSSELEEGRFVVWIQSKKGLPLQGFIASILFSMFFWRGVLITSDLQGFDTIVQKSIYKLRAKYDAKYEKRVVETTPTWLMAMLSEPAKTLKRLANEEIVPITQHDAIWLMCSVALSLAVVYSVYSIIHIQIPWAALVLFLIALGEAPLVAAFWSAIPIGEGQGMKFREGMRLYPVTLLPRWAIGFVLLILLLAGAPLMLLVPTVLGAVAIGCAFSVQLVENWFKVQMPVSLLGGLVTVIYQVFLFETFLALLPR